MSTFDISSISFGSNTFNIKDNTVEKRVYGLASVSLEPATSGVEDLNNYRTPGLVRAMSSTYAARIANAPITDAGFVVVIRYLQRFEAAANNQYVRQEAYSSKYPEKFWVRHYRGQATGWSPWYVFTGVAQSTGTQSIQQPGTLLSSGDSSE